MRPAQPVQGLSRRHRARGMAVPPRRGLVFREPDRSPSVERGHEHRPSRQDGPLRVGRRICLRPAAHRHRIASRNRLREPGFDRDNVFTLRTIADARAIADQAKQGARAVIVGASFIALEAAAALRKRGVEVDLVSVEEVPLERVFGSEIGRASAAAARTQRRPLPLELASSASSMAARCISPTTGRSTPTSSCSASASARARALPSSRAPPSTMESWSTNSSKRPFPASTPPATSPPIPTR